MADRGGRGTRSLRGTNLNLLPILRELLRQQSVTAAANQLNMSQPAVSNALTRLRTHFDDQLLIHSGGRMVPTALAMQIQPKLEEMIRTAESFFNTAAFDPANNYRPIRIAALDEIALTLGKSLLERLTRYAPNTTVQFVNIKSPTRSDLDEGKIDFLVIPRGMIPASVFNEDGLHHLVLYRENCVCIARADHPDIDSSISLELLNTLPSIALKVESSRYLYNPLPGRNKVDQLHTPQIMLLPMLVAQSDAIALVGRRIADLFASILPIQILDLPVPGPLLEISVFWSDFHRNDPMHRWVREQLEEIAKEESKIEIPAGRQASEGCR